MTSTSVFNSPKDTSNSTLFECPIDPFPRGYIDCGTNIKVPLPIILGETMRNGTIRSGPTPTPTPERPFLFAIMVDPHFSADNGGPFSSIIHNNPSWPTTNLDYTIRPVSVIHPLTIMSRNFRGWRGGLKFLICVNSSSITQGQLSFVGYRGIIGKTFDIALPAEIDEVSNNTIMNLATERRVEIAAPYNETSEWVDSFQYRDFSLRENANNWRYTVNAIRNYIVCRFDTDITTTLVNTSATEVPHLTFKIYMAPGDDFEFVYPAFPMLHQLPLFTSVVDRKTPFVTTYRLIVTQTSLIVGTLVRDLIIYNEHTQQSYAFSPTSSVGTTEWVPGEHYEGWFTNLGDFPDYALGIRWSPVYKYDLVNTGTQHLKLHWQATAGVAAEEVKDWNFGDLKVGMVLWKYHSNPNTTEAPPFYIP